MKSGSCRRCLGLQQFLLWFRSKSFRLKERLWWLHPGFGHFQIIESEANAGCLFFICRRIVLSAEQLQLTFPHIFPPSVYGQKKKLLIFSGVRTGASAGVGRGLTGVWTADCSSKGDCGEGKPDDDRSAEDAAGGSSKGRLG